MYCGFCELLSEIVASTTSNLITFMKIFQRIFDLHSYLRFFLSVKSVNDQEKINLFIKCRNIFVATCCSGNFPSLICFTETHHGKASHTQSSSNFISAFSRVLVWFYGAGNFCVLIFHIMSKANNMATNTHLML